MASSTTLGDDLGAEPSDTSWLNGIDAAVLRDDGDDSDQLDEELEDELLMRMYTGQLTTESGDDSTSLIPAPQVGDKRRRDPDEDPDGDDDDDAADIGSNTGARKRRMTVRVGAP